MSDDLSRSIELVRRAQQGDGPALNALFERYYDRVQAIVRVRLGVRLRQYVEISDILQETFAAAVESFDHFEMREESSLIHWLAKLAEHRIHAAADHHSAKKRDRRREVSLPVLNAASQSEAVLRELADSAELPVDLVAGSELRRIVEECAAELPEEYRELILLRDYAGASWEEVARQTERPSAEAARMMHARALSELATRVRARGAR